MKRLKSFWGLMLAAAITVFSAQAQDAVSQAVAPVNQDAPASVAKVVKGETVTAKVGATREFTPVSDFKAVSEAKASTAKAAKKVARKVASVNELEGTYVLTGTSLLTSGYNGVSVQVAAVGSDSIAFNDFWAAGYSTVVKAKVDVATGAISVPYQVMGQHSTYGDIVFAKTNLTDGQPVMDEEVAGTINADGSISLSDAWGAYVKASSTATTWSYFSVVNKTVLDKCNATFTGKKHSDGTNETYGVVFTQTGENVATVKNLGNYGQTVTVELNRNKTASIPSSLIAYNSTYGDFYSYNLTFTDTGASLSTDDAVTTASTDPKQLNWTNWGVVTGNTAGSRYLVAAYDECNITTTVDITYPELSVTEFEGEGTEANPYLIKTRDDLILLSDKVAEITEFDCTTPPATTAYCRAFLGKYFKVTADIDMQNYKFTPIGNDWQHIFAGTFDGDNHTISNLYVDKKTSYAGLFGRTDTVCVIKNIKFNGAIIKNQSSFSAVIAAWSLGSIENVEVANAEINGTSYAVGAVAGIAYGITNAKVSDCEITSSYGYTGGVAGEVHAPITNSSATNVNILCASASSAAPGLPTGGVVGNLYNTTMDNCYYSGAIDAYSKYSEYQTVGGVVGWASASTVKNSFAVGTIRTYGSGSVAGGVVGFLRSDVENCYFNGRVDGYSSRSTGGAFGRVQAYSMVSGGDVLECNIKNVYTAASVMAETYQYQSQTNAQHNEIIGTIIDGSNPVVTNAYFDKQVVSLTKSQYGVNTADLVAAAGPAGFDADVWQFTAGQYPALKASAATDAAKLASVAVVLPQGASFDKFTKDADLNMDGSVVVKFVVGGELTNAGNYATINGNKININTESKFGNDTIYYFSPVAGYYYRIAKVAPIPFDGAGTEEEPFLIKTKADMILLSQLTTVTKQLFPETYFKMANDIDLELDEAFLGICTDAADAHNYFAGSFDGDGHTIHRMKFNAVQWTTTPEQAGEGNWGTINTSGSSAYKGLVGRLDANGVVKNVNIAADCDLHFYASSGALVGYSAGVVENCRNYADVMGNSCWIGGVVGQNLKEGKIRNCYNEGNVVGGYGQVGGIAGATYSIIENCMNVGRVEIRQLATNYANQLQSAGGIVGTSSSGGKFVNCVNAGTVSAQIKRAGGITGYWSAVSATSTASYYKNDMINCINYGTALTADAATIGAIAGGETQSTSEEIYGVYWDAQILDVPADANAAHEGMNGVETSVLTSGTALEGFDTEVWKFEAGKYPVLKAFADEPKVQAAAATQVVIPTGVTHKNLTADATVAAGTATLAQGTKFTLEGNTIKGIPTTEEVINDTLQVVNNGFVKIITLSALPVNPLQGSGTAEDPWQITNAQEWNALANFMSKTANDLTGEYVKVMNDIDFSNEAAGIIPLGSDGVTVFNGNMDGNNTTISGYNYTTAVAGMGALFGTVGAEGTVSNITAAGNITGGLGGAKGTTKLGYVGGVVGKLYGTLYQVNNKGKVTGIATYTAGITAYAYQGSKLTYCTNAGEVTSAAANVAGIAAYVYEGVEFNQCINTGKISSSVATAYAAGIASYALPSTYKMCINDGEISGGTSAGIVANCAGKANVGPYTFDQCVNTGNITGNATLGGITAMQGATAGNNVCNYTDCVNVGDITATSTSAVSSSSMAGIAAFYSAGSTFDNCYNEGFITNSKNVYTAGITGYYKGSASATYPVVVKNCVNAGNITSQAQQIAGIIAYVSNYVTIDSCVNSANIEQGMWGAAGICYTLAGANSVLTNCVNTGDVTVGTYLAGGIVGNNANNASVIKGNVNVGNITSNVAETVTTNNYGVGGIAGSAYTTITDCVNFGNVKGQVRVGGIVGSPSYYATAARTQLVNCVNAGAVSGKTGCAGALVGTEAGNEAKYWGDNNSATNCYYLNDVSFKGAAAGIGDVNNIGTGVSVAELVSVDMNSSAGEAAGAASQTWVKADEYSFSVPAVAAENATVAAHAAAVVLAEGDTYNNVTKAEFNVGNANWNSSSDIVVINGNNVNVTEETEGVQVVLTSVDETEDYNVNAEWHLTLNVKDITTGIDANTVGKVVADEAYYTTAGVKVEKPASKDGQVYIVVRKYTDGTMGAYKFRN